MEKRTTFEKNKIDRLSNLPGNLILCILTLIDTKEAVKTSILSKRWSHLWTCLPKLHFDSQSFKTLDSFKKFVSFVLSQRDDDCTLQSLWFYSESTDKSFIKRVIGYAMLHGIQEISIITPAVICFHSLETASLVTIHLKYVSLLFENSDSIDLFSDCRNLEELSITDCNCLNVGTVVKISAPHLAKLNIWNVQAEDLEFVICTPRLSVFHYGVRFLNPTKIFISECHVLERVGFYIAYNGVFPYDMEILKSYLENLYWKAIQNIIPSAKSFMMQLCGWKVIVVEHNGYSTIEIYRLEGKVLFPWKFQCSGSKKFVMEAYYCFSSHVCHLKKVIWQLKTRTGEPRTSWKLGPDDPVIRSILNQLEEIELTHVTGKAMLVPLET
ncbi:hypothetical protein SLE2022_120370 [Rubroshorea leprosula]